MFKIFDEKSKEYGIDNENIFIRSKSISTIEYCTKQEVSFNLSERKNYQLYEYAVKWISSSKNISDQVADDDIYIVWPIKESKCRALTLSTSDFRGSDCLFGRISRKMTHHRSLSNDVVDAEKRLQSRKNISEIVIECHYFGKLASYLYL